MVTHNRTVIQAFAADHGLSASKALGIQCLVEASKQTVTYDRLVAALNEVEAWTYEQKAANPEIAYGYTRKQLEFSKKEYFFEMADQSLIDDKMTAFALDEAVKEELRMRREIAGVIAQLPKPNKFKSAFRAASRRERRKSNRKK